MTVCSFQCRDCNKKMTLAKKGANNKQGLKALEIFLKAKVQEFGYLGDFRRF